MYLAMLFKHVNEGVGQIFFALGAAFCLVVSFLAAEAPYRANTTARTVTFILVAWVQKIF